MTAEIIIQNIVNTVDVKCVLDLRVISLKACNVEYKPNRFAALIMRIRNPRTTALIFSSGKLVITGAKSEKDSLNASKRFVRILKKLGFPVSFNYFKIQNVVGSINLGFNVSLEGLNIGHENFTTYEPELFPGLIYRVVGQSVVILIFHSGKMIITGARKKEEIYEAFENIYSVVKHFKK